MFSKRMSELILNRINLLIFVITFSVTSQFIYAKDFLLKSPDNKINLMVSVDKELKWSASFKGSELIKPGILSLKLKDGSELGKNPVIKNSETKSVDEKIESVVPVNSKFIRDNYNELTINFKGDYSVAFRAYNDGVAYRFITNLKQKEITVEWENVTFNFAGDYKVFFPEEEIWDFISHYERLYKNTKLSAITDTQFCSLPVLIAADENVKMLITDADLFDYPNMFLYGKGGTSFISSFPKVTLESKAVSDRDDDIIKLADYIAVTQGKRTFPWRVVVITENDKDLLENNLVYKLSSPNVIKETSWIKPGKVAWDWWNALNIYGVDFPSGINTNTYKYYIDFAAQFGLEYIILDEGWSKTSHNLLEATKDLDLEELIKYGESKNVGVILWVLWNALDKDMENILDHFAKWGAKGVKVDFMQRADQWMVNYYERCARECAKRNLTVDYHGAYKPAGLNRKYPNVLSYEGVKGLENSKWGMEVTPIHDVTLPFTRMVAGPMDFTPGAMLNGNEENFRPIWSAPMSQGTRAHQTAMYVVYTSPLQMLCDSPSKYLQDTTYTRFISRFPSVWDETVALESKAGEYVAVARKKDNYWYIGAMTDWTSRELNIPLAFLDNGNYTLEFVQDGINADKYAADYIQGKQNITSAGVLKIKLAKGGGWAGILSPVK